ncbi:DUF3396 domain-containing protein [Hyalangium gracile]|uniref:DUF3396 domain-containing protein n=1 Tax=Hyalangium gracile TaxID=394092 RepID=UPI001CCD91DB|nr:DUF3396 domain-containing protein [Hyalangium gracile]
MSEHYPRIRIRAQNGALLLREGLSLCFYIRHPHSSVGPMVRRALEIYQRAIKPDELTLYPLDDDWETLDEKAWENIRQKLLASRVALVRLSDRPGSDKDYHFYYYGRPVGDPSESAFPGTVCALECWLPTEFLEQHGPERVRALALEMAEQLPFCSGHVGLAFNGELDLVGVPEEIRRYCFRYPGLDIVHLGRLVSHLGTRVRGPHWMTFLGQPVLSALGGAPTLRARLTSPGTTVQELNSERAVITLGEWPEAGDTDRGLALPAYRELARILEPWTYFEEHITGNESFLENRRRWERRFLD